MSEWTLKLGFAIPSWNTVIEYETARMLPPGVSLHVSRIPHTDDSEASLVAMGEHFPAHLELLGHAGVDVTCFACTAAGFLHGWAYELDYLHRMQAQSPKPVVSMAGAVVEAARHLGLQRVVVAAPYEQWLLSRLVGYLESAGLTVVRAAGLGQQANILHAPSKAAELGLGAWSDDADGLILSCSNFRTLEAIPALERRLRKPVLTSNTSALWSLLSVTDWHGVIPDAGMLLERHRRPPRTHAAAAS